MKGLFMYIVYLLTNKINNKIYVGVTNNYPKRMREHKAAKNNFPISRAIRKYGWENFDSQILFESVDCSHTYLVAESKFIKQYNSQNPDVGYNLTSGGQETPGYTPSKETRLLMRNRKLGKKLGVQQKRSISESNKGRVFSESTRKKISEKLKGNKNFAGKTFTEATKKLLSQQKAQTWHVVSPEKLPMTITNMRKFCQENNLSPSAMSRVLNDLKPHHKGWTKG